MQTLMEDALGILRGISTRGTEPYREACLLVRNRLTTAQVEQLSQLASHRSPVLNDCLFLPRAASELRRMGLAVLSNVLDDISYTGITPAGLDVLNAKETP